jgi:diguanylate cyclase (GGDEF)-like protein
MSTVKKDVRLQAEALAEDIEVDEGWKILVVDDEEIMRSFLRDVLSGEDYQVDVVPTGEEAIEEAGTKEYDLVITDIKMPGTNGMEVLREVKERSPKTEVVVMTAYASLESAVESMKLGAADYITKPFNIDQVRIVVAKTLEKRRLRQKAEDEEFYKHLSRTDGLTNLYNQRFFHQLLESELSRAKRFRQSLCLLMLDIDNFKLYNDTHGHLAGNQALKQLAWIFKKSVRSCDMVARYGGEEFAIIAPQTDLEGGKILAARLNRLVREAIFDMEDALPRGRLTVSIGVSSFPDQAADERSLIERSDQALYQAKAQGRDRVCLYGEEDEEG